MLLDSHPEERATRGRDPSAEVGTKTDGQPSGAKDTRHEEKPRVRENTIQSCPTPRDEKTSTLMSSVSSTAERLGNPSQPPLQILLWLCTIAVSLVFHWNIFSTQITADTFTVDSYFYVELARELQKLAHAQPSYIDPLRTPGYPLLFLLAATTLDIDLKSVEMSPTDHTKLNKPGQKLVERVLVWQQYLAFLIPPLIYLVFLLLANNAYVAFACAFCYYADLPTISYQHTLLSEFSSIFFLWLALALFAYGLKRARGPALAASGLALALAAIIRPPLVLMPVVLAPFAALGLAALPWRQRLAKSGLFLAAAVSLPVAWSLLQLFLGFGHFVFTTNGVFTLQLFAAPRLAAMDLDSNDPALHELATLKKHLIAYKQAGGTNGFALTEVQAAVMKELGWTNYYDYYLLQKKAALHTIAAFPGDFIALAVDKFDFFWRQPFYYIITPYALDRTQKMPFFPKVFSQDKMLLAKSWTLPIFILACLAAAWLAPQPAQKQFIYAQLAFILLFTTITATIGMDEPDRHAMQVRTLIDALIVYGAWSVLSALATRLKLPVALATALRSFGRPILAAGCLLAFGLWLPLHYDSHRNLDDLDNIRHGLERFRAARGHYPKSLDWSGRHSPDTSSPTLREEWIPGLTPEFMPCLPRDPRNSSNPQEQYLYRSNGTDYKLISHGVADCYSMAQRRPERVDPARRCYAYGFWTPGAGMW